MFPIGPLTTQACGHLRAGTRMVSSSGNAFPGLCPFTCASQASGPLSLLCGPAHSHVSLGGHAGWLGEPRPPWAHMLFEEEATFAARTGGTSPASPEWADERAEWLNFFFFFFLTHFPHVNYFWPVRITLPLGFEGS